MLDELKFVQGGVGKTDVVAAMTHFCIENGEIRATNGRIALGSPIACDLNIKPKAKPLVAAISDCEDTIALSLTPAGKLRIRSGDFAASVDCTGEDYHYPRPEGVAARVDGEKLILALAALKPFMADRRTEKEFAKGVCLRGKSAFATNGVAVGEYWIGSDFPMEAIIPYEAVVELLRIKKAPQFIQMTDRSITFQYEGRKWLRTALIAAKFPDTEPLFSKIKQVEGPFRKLPDDIFTVVKKLKKHIDEDGFFYLDEGNVRTTLDMADGARHKLVFAHDLYRLKLADFLTLEGFVNEVKLSTFESGLPMFFRGGAFRAALSPANPNF